LLSDAGLGQGTKKTPQIFIGNAAANLRQLTSGFSIFPNEGVRRRPFLIDRVIDRNGRIIYSTPVLETEVISPGVAHLARRLLSKVIDEGTASSIRSEHGFREPAGGKTGTTNDYKDAWFCGYSDRLTCGVWLGLDQPKTIIDEGYAGRLAVPIWADVMNASVKLGYVSRGPRVEVPLTSVALCRASGHIATESCYQQNSAYQDNIPYELVPQNFCSVHDGSGPGSRQMPVPDQPRPSLWQRLRGMFQ
jgi:penicillin-binding protein 1A